MDQFGTLDIEEVRAIGERAATLAIADAIFKHNGHVISGGKPHRIDDVQVWLVHREFVKTDIRPRLVSAVS